MLAPWHVAAWGLSMQVRTLGVEYAERENEYDILFRFSLFCAYVHIEYVRMHVIYRV